MASSVRPKTILHKFRMTNTERMTKVEIRNQHFWRIFTASPFELRASFEPRWTATRYNRKTGKNLTASLKENDSNQLRGKRVESSEENQGELRVKRYGRARAVTGEKRLTACSRARRDWASNPPWISNNSSMSKQQLVRSKREQILSAARKHGAISVRLFGSVARGDDAEGSDLDFLVELEPGRSLLDLGGLQMELERLLGCHVDVVTAKGLRERIRARVLEETLPV